MRTLDRRRPALAAMNIASLKHQHSSLQADMQRQNVQPASLDIDRQPQSRSLDRGEFSPLDSLLSPPLRS